MATKVSHETTEMLEAVFSVRSMPKLYIERQLPLEDFETAVGRVGGWCYMAASLGVSRSNDLVVGQSPAGKNVSTETQDIVESRC
jgi:hypothetical protein